MVHQGSGVALMSSDVQRRCTDQETGHSCNAAKISSGAMVCAPQVARDSAAVDGPTVKLGLEVCAQQGTSSLKPDVIRVKDYRRSGPSSELDTIRA